MKSGTKIFLFIFLVIIIVFGILALAYFNNTFPVLNNFVDSKFFPEKIDIKETIFVEEEIIEVPKDNLPSISSIDSVYDSLKITKPFVSKNLDEYILPNIVLTLENNCYSLVASNDVSWEVDFSYPIISPPVIYNDKIALITADSNFVLLDLFSGATFESLDIGVTCFTSTKEGLQETKYGFLPVYDFITEDEKSYSVLLNSNKFSKDQLIKSEKQENILSLVKGVFEPSKEAKAFFASRLSSWGVEISENLIPAVEFFLEDEKYLFNDDAVRLFLYHPKNPGKCQIGLMNENGGFATDNAVVAVFNEDGTLVEVSLGYVATEPNVSVYLEDELYYIIAYRVFVDESSLENVYLGVKKAL